MKPVPGNDPWQTFDRVPLIVLPVTQGTDVAGGRAQQLLAATSTSA